MKREIFIIILYLSLFLGFIPDKSVKANLLDLQKVKPGGKEMTQNFQVRLSMNQAAIVKSGLVLKQGDFGMNLEIEVLNFDTSNTTPQIVFRKPMGAVESTSVTKSGNVYTYTLRGTELDTPGKVICDLKLKNSTTQRISTASFSFEVVADTLNGLAEESNSYSDTVEQIVQGFVGQMVSAMEKFNDQNTVVNDIGGRTIGTEYYNIKLNVTGIAASYDIPYEGYSGNKYKLKVFGLSDTETTQQIIYLMRSDSSYQNAGHFVIGEDLTFTANADFTSIRVYTYYTIGHNMPEYVEADLSIIDCYNSPIDTINTEVDCIKNALSINKYTLLAGGSARYIDIPVNGLAGDNFNVTIWNLSDTETTSQLIYLIRSDSSYQSVGAWTVGTTKKFQANADFVYLRVYALYASDHVFDGSVSAYVSYFKDNNTINLAPIYQLDKGYSATNAGYIGGSGQFISLANPFRTTGFIPVKENTQGYLIGTLGALASGYYNIWAYDKDQDPIGGIYVYSDNNRSFKIPQGTKYIRIVTDTSNLYSYSVFYDFAEVKTKTYKTMGIIGDSYSTFEGWLPSGQATFYPHEGNGVNSVSDTWFGKLAEMLGCTILKNDSWSGSTIATTVREGYDISSSFVYRIDHNSFGENQRLQPKPELLIIYGGTNDDWINTEVGVPQYSDWTDNDLKKVLPAFCYVLDKAIKNNPGCKIVNVLNTNQALYDTDLRAGMIEVCEHYGILNVIIPNISLNDSHATAAGMTTIAKSIYNALMLED